MSDIIYILFGQKNAQINLLEKGKKIVHTWLNISDFLTVSHAQLQT